MESVTVIVTVFINHKGMPFSEVQKRGVDAVVDALSNEPAIKMAEQRAINSYLVQSPDGLHSISVL